MYLASIVKIIQRGIKTTPPLRDTTSTRRLAKFKKLQADFQVEDGRPIFLKRGFLDRGLYLTTVLLCFAGVFLTLLCIYDHAKPESWKQK